MGWVGVATAVTAAVIFLIVAHIIKSDDKKDRELISEKYRQDYPPQAPYDYYPQAYPGPYGPQGPPYVMELGGHSLPRGQRAIAYPEQQWSWS